MHRLNRLTPGQIQQYYYLEASDVCFCLGLYHPGEGFEGRGLNSIIFDLKKKPGSLYSEYKDRVIARIASSLRASLNDGFPGSDLTLVPVPPSKKIGESGYDDRMLRICHQMAAGPGSTDVLDMLTIRQSVAASHEVEQRPSKHELKQNLVLNIDKKSYESKRFICLLDDVLTTGAHYSACKAVLQEAFPGVTVIGVFVARVERDLRIDS